VNPRRLDALIAGALFAGLTAETLTSSHLHGPVALNVLASAGASLPFAWRRVYPVAVVAVVITSAGLEAAFLTDFTDLTTALVVPLLAAYTLGEQLERRASYVALAATYVGAMAVEVIDHGLRPNEVVLIAFYLLAALLGVVAIPLPLCLIGLALVPIHGALLLASSRVLRARRKADAPA